MANWAVPQSLWHEDDISQLLIHELSFSLSLQGFKDSAVGVIDADFRRLQFCYDLPKLNFY